MKDKQREKSMRREEAKGGDSKSVKREKKTKGREEMREFVVRKAE